MTTKGISVSIGGEDIVFEEKENAPETSISLSVKKSKFMFEFDGQLTDKFIVKKYVDNFSNKNVTEIHLQRGLGINMEEIRLVRISSI